MMVVMNPRHAALVLAPLLALSACGGGQTSPAPAASTTAAKPAESACLAVPASLSALIAKRFSTPFTLTSAKAVKSPDFKSVHFVALKGDIEGSKGETYVFAVGGESMAAPDSILAADAFAQEFTDYPKGNESGAKIDKADPSITAAKKCVG